MQQIRVKYFKNGMLRTKICGKRYSKYTDNSNCKITEKLYKVKIAILDQFDDGNTYTQLGLTGTLKK